MPKFVPGRGSATARIMMVGEAPGSTEEETGECWVGPAGQLLQKIANDAGISLSDVYFTNVRKYQPPNNDFQVFNPGEPSLQEQLEFLDEEINAINPNIIVFLGANAFESVSDNKGILLHRGSLFLYKGRKALGTFHPARLLHSDGGKFAPYWQKHIIEFDLRRALDESGSRTLELPHRLLQICKSPLQLYQFVERNSKDSRADGYVDSDIESSNCIPSCISLAFHPGEAISIPLLPSLWGIKYTDMTPQELAQCWLIVAKILADPKWKKSGHNFHYDEPKINLYGFYLDKLSFDTQLASHSLCPEWPQSLAFNTSIWTKEPFYKEEGRGFNPKKDKVDRLLLYNAKDSAVTNEVRRGQMREITRLGLEEFFYDFVMKLHPLYLGIEKVGFKVDEDVRRTLVEKYVQRQLDKERELHSILGFDCNVASPKQVAATLYEHLKFPRRAGTGEDVLVSLMGNHAKTPEKIRVLKLIIEIRKVRKTIGTYLMASPDYDGRMRTSIFITGTETGRTSDRIMEPPLRPEAMGLAFKTMTKHGDVGADLRTIFVPDTGHVFVNMDLSQAESRVVANLVEDYEKLRLMNEHDIHSVTASWVYGGDYAAWTKARHGGNEPPERFIGKTLRHAGERGMEKRRLMEIVNTDSEKYGIDLTISEYKAGLILDVFHRNDRGIRGGSDGTWTDFSGVSRPSYFKLIEDALKDNNRLLVGPYGRRRIFFERWGKDLFKEAYSHLPQQIVGDKIKKVMLAIKHYLPNTQIILESHDAFMAQVPIPCVDEFVKVGQAAMTAPIPFTGTFPRPDLVIPCDVEIGVKNYKELKKYRKL